jgi:hypothetical protein
MEHLFRRTVGAQFAPAEGARVALAMVPALVGIAVLGGTRVGGTVPAGALLGVLFVASCDLGPTLHIRVQAMGTGTVVGALLLGLGCRIGGPWWVAMLALAAMTFVSGLLSLVPSYGPLVAQVGIVLTILLALALGRDGGPAAAVPSALGFLLGGWPSACLSWCRPRLAGRRLPVARPHELHMRPLRQMRQRHLWPRQACPACLAAPAPVMRR